MFKRKFVTNLFFLLVLNVLIKPFWIFGIDRTVQNIVAPEDYGLYFTILNFTFIINILLDLGITNFNNRNIAQHSFLLNKHFSSLLLLRIVLGFIYILVIFIIALVIGYSGKHLYFLFFLAINQFLASLILYLRSNISGLMLFKTDSIISILDRVIMILICGMLLWGRVTKEPFQITWFIYSQTFSYLITALIAFIIVVNKSKFKKMVWNLPFFITILKRSLPFALLVLLMSFYNRLDAVMIERMLDKGVGVIQANIYGKAFRWLDAINMVSYLFSVLLLPIFARLIKLNSSVNEILKTAFLLIFTFIIIAGIQSSFFAKPIIEMLYYSQHDESIQVFRVLILCCIPISMTYIFGTLLTANNNLKQLNIMSATALTINLLLNLILIPKLMALGSAYASLTTQIFVAVVQIILTIKIFKIKMKNRFIFKIGIFVLLVIGINAIFTLTDLNWMLEFILVFVLSLLSSVVCKLINIKNILLLFTQKEADILPN